LLDSLLQEISVLINAKMSVVSNLYNQLADVTSRTRSGRGRTPAISGRSTSQERGNVAGVLGGRSGESPSNFLTENVTRGRQGRVLSQPDPRLVEEVRQDERLRGGPSAPRNSLDLSVVILDESIDNINETSGENLNAEFVFEENSLNEVRGPRYRRREVNLIREEVFGADQGVPPVNPSLRVVQNVHNNDSEIEEEVALSIVETTIDLTDSPPRIFPPVLSLLPSEAPTRPPRSMYPSEVTVCPPRIFPRLRLLPSEVSPPPHPHIVPQDLPTMLPDRRLRPTQHLTPQRSSSRTFFTSRSSRIESPNTPPRPPRLLLSPQPPRPRSLSHQQANVDSPRLTQLNSPPPSMKCPVCLEPFQSIRSRGSNLVSTTCGHVFCGKCLPACVRINGNCPTCRKTIGYEDFHPLYLF